MEADQEDLKCQLSMGSQERTVSDHVIVHIGIDLVALIWRCFNLDLELLQTEPGCGYPLRRSGEPEVKQ